MAIVNHECWRTSTRAPSKQSLENISCLGVGDSEEFHIKFLHHLASETDHRRVDTCRYRMDAVSPPDVLTRSCGVDFDMKAVKWDRNPPKSTIIDKAYHHGTESARLGERFYHASLRPTNLKPLSFIWPRAAGGCACRSRNPTRQMSNLASYC